MNGLQTPALLRRSIRVCAQWIAWGGILLLLMNVFLQIGDVLSRWLFAAPQSWVADIQEITLPVAIAACFPEALIQRSMISITFLGAALGKRAVALLDQIGMLALLLVFCVGTFEVTVYASEIAVSGRGTWLMNLPLAPVWFVVAALFLVSSIVQAFVLVTPEWAPQPEE